MQTKNGTQSKCPFHRLLGLKSVPVAPKSSVPFYDDLISADLLKRAAVEGRVTDDPNEGLFYLPHQQAQLLWHYAEEQVAYLAHRTEAGEANAELWLKVTGKIIQLLLAANAQLGFLTKVLTVEEFLAIRDSLLPASGFQSLYHSTEIVLTDLAFLQYPEMPQSPIDGGFSQLYSNLYWLQSSAGDRTVLDMLRHQGIESKAQRWRGCNLAKLYLHAPDSIKRDEKVIGALKRIDAIFAKGFKDAHLKLAIAYLPDITTGSGGTEFEKYLAESGKVSLYPFLH